jgi:hypothetical protein
MRFSSLACCWPTCGSLASSANASFPNAMPASRAIALPYRTIGFWEAAAFWLLLTLHLLPLCGGRYFPTADGPTHLYNAWLWKAMLLQPAHPAHQVLAFNPNPEPNYLSHLLLVGFLSIGPPWVAEKLLLGLYVVGLPLALRYALRSGGQASAGWLAVLGFPLVYSVVLVWGFYNFCLSLILLLVVSGYWQRHTGRWRPATIAGLAGLLTLLYSAHPMTYLVSGLLLGLLAVVTNRAWPGRLLTELGILLLTHLPTLLLLAWYAAHKGTATSQPALDYGANLWEWFRLEPIHYFGSAEATYRWLVAGLLTVAVAVAGLRLMRRQAAGWPVLPWALGVLLLLGAYMAMPDAIAGGSITRPRWGLLSYLALLAGLAAVPWLPRWRAIGLGSGTLAAVLLLGFRLPKFQAFQAGVAEYQSLAPYLRPGATILPIAYDAENRLPDALAINTYIPTLSEAANYLAVEHQLVSYENYEALAGYFPLVWRPGKAPLLAVGQPPARLAPFLAEPAHRPTYVLLQGRLAATSMNPDNAALITSYLAHFSYTLRYRSPHRLLELYERSPAARK